MAWDLTAATYTNNSVDLSSDGNMVAIAMSSDGTYAITVDDSCVFYGYSLSTAYDISSASHDSTTYDATFDGCTLAFDLYLNSTGTKLYFLSDDGFGAPMLYEYDLSPAYDVSGIGGASDSGYIFATATDYCFGMDIDSTGTYMFLYAGDSMGYYVYRYEFATPWSASTIDYDYMNNCDVSGDVGSIYGQVTSGISLSDDGTKLFVNYASSAANRGVVQYTLSTAWDLTSIGSADTSFNVISDIGSGVVFGHDFAKSGERMYVINDSYEVHEYSMPGSGLPIGAMNTVVSANIATVNNVAVAGIAAVNGVS